MQLGMIGLGRMGANMATRLMKAGHVCIVYDSHPVPVQGRILMVRHLISRAQGSPHATISRNALR